MDETDSGLDVDALRIVSEGVNRAKESTGLGILMVTHYTRILKYIKPDIVHVFADGHFVKTGGPELADELEETGYDKYLPWPDFFVSLRLRCGRIAGGCTIPDRKLGPSGLERSREQDIPAPRGHRRKHDPPLEAASE